MARAGGAAKRASTVVKLSKGGKKKSMIKKGVAASSNRLASGQSSELRDVGGNTEKSLSALEGLVAGDEPGGLNSAEGAMRLQAMMQGESMKLDKGKKLKSEFGAVDEGLLDALKAEPDDRTDDHLKLIEKHCAWHPIFKDIKPMLRRKMFRYLRAKFFKFGEVIVLQGDEAASFCICYQGSMSVHLWQDPAKVKEMRKGRDKLMASVRARVRRHQYGACGEVVRMWRAVSVCSRREQREAAAVLDTLRALAACTRPTSSCGVAWRRDTRPKCSRSAARWSRHSPRARPSGGSVRRRSRSARWRSRRGARPHAPPSRPK